LTAAKVQFELYRIATSSEREVKGQKRSTTLSYSGETFKAAEPQSTTHGHSMAEKTVIFVKVPVHPAEEYLPYRWRVF
jgi:hypothetical protein